MLRHSFDHLNNALKTTVEPNTSTFQMELFSPRRTAIHHYKWTDASVISMAQGEQQSALDKIIESAIDPVINGGKSVLNETLGSHLNTQDSYAGTARFIGGIAKSAVLFASASTGKGKLAVYAATFLLNGLDKANADDWRKDKGEFFLDALQGGVQGAVSKLEMDGLGAAKRAMSKKFGIKEGSFAARALIPAEGLLMGLSSPLTDNLLTRQNWFDKSGRFSAGNAVSKAINNTFNTDSLISSTVTFTAGVSGSGLVARLCPGLMRSKIFQSVVSGGSLGAFNGMSSEIHNVRQSGQSLMTFDSVEKIALAGFKQASSDAIGAAIGGRFSPAMAHGTVPEQGTVGERGASESTQLILTESFDVSVADGVLPPHKAIVHDPSIARGELRALAPAEQNAYTAIPVEAKDGRRFNLFLGNDGRLFHGRTNESGMLTHIQEAHYSLTDPRTISNRVTDRIKSTAIEISNAAQAAGRSAANAVQGLLPNISLGLEPVPAYAASMVPSSSAGAVSCPELAGNNLLFPGTRGGGARNARAIDDDYKDEAGYTRKGKRIVETGAKQPAECAFNDPAVAVSKWKGMTLQDAWTIQDRSIIGDEEQLKAYIKEKNYNSVDRWLAFHIFQHGEVITDVAQFTELTEQAMEHIRIRRQIEGAIKEIPPDTQELFALKSGRLKKAGIETEQQARNFIALWTATAVPGRPFGSSYNQAPETVALIAKSSFSELPLHTQALLVKHVSQDTLRQLLSRPGALRPLISCAKAWEFAPNLPKSVAERIGELPRWKRYAAAMSWNELGNDMHIQSLSLLQTQKESGHSSNEPMGAGNPNVSRTELINGFWRRFNELCGSGQAEVLRRYGNCRKVVGFLNNGTMDANHAKLLASLMDQAKDKGSRENQPKEISQDSFAFFSKLDKQAFVEAYDHLSGGSEMPSKLRQIDELANQDRAKHALTISSIFGKNWTAWLEGERELGRSDVLVITPGGDKTGLAEWLMANQKKLPFATLSLVAKHWQSSGTPELRNWLISNSDKSEIELADIASNWHRLDEQARKLPYEQLELEHLWLPDETIPPHLTENWNSLLPWQKIAANTAWENTATERREIGWKTISQAEKDVETTACFNKAFDELKKVGQEGALRASTNTSTTIAALHSINIPGPYRRVLAEWLKKSVPLPQHYDIINGLNVASFREAYDFMVGREQGSSELPTFDRSKAKAALALSLTFGDQWKSWIEKTKLTASSIDRNQLVEALPIGPAAQRTGLADWLVSNSDKSNVEVAHIASNWHRLDEQTRKLPYEQLELERLWLPDETIPSHLTHNWNSLLPWQKIAANTAWEKTAMERYEIGWKSGSQAEKDAETTACFNKAFDELKKLGQEGVLRASTDTSTTIAALHGINITGPYRRVLAEWLIKSVPLPQHYDIINGLNVASFREAYDFMGGGKLDSSELSASDQSKAKAALALSLTFGDQWKSWIEKTKLTASSIDRNQLVEALPIRPATQIAGLADWLGANSDKPKVEVAHIASNWHRLDEQTRKLPYEQLELERLWLPDVTIPSHLTQNWSSLPTWQKIAANTAWEKTATERSKIEWNGKSKAEKDAETTACFNKAFDQLKKVGQEGVLRASTNTSMMIAASHGTNIAGPYRRVLVECLKKSVPLPQHYDIINGLNVAVFREAFDSMRLGKVDDSQLSAHDRSNAKAALALSLAFGDQWKSGLTRMMHLPELVAALPIRPAPQLVGLDNWLRANTAKPEVEVAHIASNWHRLDEQTRKLPYEQLELERLWLPYETIPSHLIQNWSSLPTWQKIAANAAWENTARQRSEIGWTSVSQAKGDARTAVCFNKAFDELKKVGQEGVLRASTNTGTVIAALHGTNIAGPYRRVLAEWLKKSVPLPQHYDIINSLNVAVFRQAYDFMGGRILESPESLAFEQPTAKAALALSLTFGDQWKEWAQKTKLTARSIDSNQLVEALPIRPAAQLASLAVWLHANTDKPFSEQAQIIGDWHRLDQTTRQKALAGELSQSQLFNEHYWLLDPKIPSSIAESLGQLPPWQRLAANKAWSECANATQSDSQTNHSQPAANTLPAGSIENKFSTKLSQLCNLGRDGFLKVYADVDTLVSAYHSSSLDAPHQRLLSATLGAVASDMSRDQIFAMVRGLKTRAFFESYKRLSGGKMKIADLPIGQLQNKLNESWEAKSALGLVSTFGNDWGEWLRRQNALGCNDHDAVHYLPIAPASQLEGLSGWLYSHNDRYWSLKSEIPPYIAHSLAEPPDKNQADNKLPEWKRIAVNDAWSQVTEYLKDRKKAEKAAHSEAEARDVVYAPTEKPLGSMTQGEREQLLATEFNRRFNAICQDGEQAVLSRGSHDPVDRMTKIPPFIISSLTDVPVEKAPAKSMSSWKHFAANEAWSEVAAYLKERNKAEIAARREAVAKLEAELKAIDDAKQKATAEQRVTRDDIQKSLTRILIRFQLKRLATEAMPGSLKSMSENELKQLTANEFDAHFKTICALGEKAVLKRTERDSKDLMLVSSNWQYLDQEHRKLSPKELIEYCQSRKYKKQVDASLAVEASRNGVQESGYPQLEQRFLGSQGTPSPFPLDRSWKVENLVGRFLPRSDPRGMFLGHYLNCCQHPTGAAASCAFHGQESPKGGFFLVEDADGNEVAGSWAWESDDGGLCFDSIEGKGLPEEPEPKDPKLKKRIDDIIQVYKNAANGEGVYDKHHRATVGKIKGGKHGLPDADEKKLKLPSDYSGYSGDSSSQSILAENPSIPKKTAPDQKDWVRGGRDTDLNAALAIAKQVYPESWDHLPEGMDYSLVLEAHGKGVVGYAAVDTVNREVLDVGVLKEHRDKSGTLLYSLLSYIERVGGEWSADCRETTSYRLLQLAAKRRNSNIIILEDQVNTDKMGNEQMHHIRFTVNHKDAKPKELKTAV